MLSPIKDLVIAYLPVKPIEDSKKALSKLTKVVSLTSLVGFAILALIVASMGVMSIALCPGIPPALFLLGLGGFVVSCLALASSYLLIRQMEKETEAQQTEMKGIQLRPEQDPTLVYNPKWVTDVQIEQYVLYLQTQYPDANIETIPPPELSENADINEVGEYYNRPPQETALEHLKEFLINSPNSTKNVPLFLNIDGSHWTFVFIDRERGKVRFYDSFNGSNRKINKTLENLAKELSKATGTKYKFENRVQSRLQYDSYQCGIWSLCFYEDVLINPDVIYKNIPRAVATERVKAYRKVIMDKLQEIQDLEKLAKQFEMERYIFIFGEEKVYDQGDDPNDPQKGRLKAEIRRDKDIYDMDKVERLNNVLKREYLRPEGWKEGAV